MMHTVWMILFVAAGFKAEANVVDKHSVEPAKCNLQFENPTTDGATFTFDSPPLNRTQSCLAACYLKENGAMNAKNYIEGVTFLNIYESYLNHSVSITQHNLLVRAEANCTVFQTTTESDECVAFEKFWMCFEEARQEINDKIVDMCANNVSKSEMSTYTSSTKLLQRIPENRHEACLGACVLKELGMMNDKNQFNVQTLLRYYDRTFDEKQKALLVGCNEKLHESDECVAFKRFMECNMNDLLPWRNYDDKNIAALHHCTSDNYMTSDKLSTLELSYSSTKRERTCLGACYLKNMSVMDSNNVIHATEIIRLQGKHYEEEYGPFISQKTIEFLKKCAEEQMPESDECDSFKNYMGCVGTKIMNLDPREFVLKKCLEVYDVPKKDSYNVILLHRAPKTRSESCLGHCFAHEFGAYKGGIVRRHFEGIYGKVRDSLLAQCVNKESVDPDECVAWANIVKCFFENIE